MRWRRARREAAPAAPTLILPEGTRIEVDAHGQLSISAPGNLVIQSSGRYGTLESQAGSIRIDRAVEVEAVTVRCAETCYVQGNLTAWRVIARALHLAEGARARVVLQETGSLEVGRDARLVGGFATEGEIFGLFSRFAREVRALSFLGERRTPGEIAGPSPPEPQAPPDLALAAPPEAAVPGGSATGTSAPGHGAPAAAPEPPTAPAPVRIPSLGSTFRTGGLQGLAGLDDPGDATLAGVASIVVAFDELPESLLFALVLLEREAERHVQPPVSQRALEETIKLLQQQDLETLRHTWRTLFGRIAEPREDAARARELLAQHFTGASSSISG